MTDPIAVLEEWAGSLPNNHHDLPGAHRAIELLRIEEGRVGALAHLSPVAGDRVRVTLDGIVTTDLELHVGWWRERSIGLFPRAVRSVDILATNPIPEDARECMNHDGRPAVGGLAICEDCRAALVVRHPVKDDPRA